VPKILPTLEPEPSADHANDSGKRVTAFQTRFRHFKYKALSATLLLLGVHRHEPGPSLRNTHVDGSTNTAAFTSRPPPIIGAGIAQWYSAVLRTRLSGVRVPAGAENFSLHRHVQTGSGAHPAS
jgi:hypothetical protein